MDMDMDMDIYLATLIRPRVGSDVKLTSPEM
jgi:hypothetical protein